MLMPYSRTRESVWTKVPGQASDIAISSKGDVWAIGAEGAVHKQNYGVQRWDSKKGAWETVGGSGIRISVEPDGTPWVVNGANEIYRGNGRGGWTRYRERPRTSRAAPTGPCSESRRKISDTPEAT